MNPWAGFALLVTFYLTGSILWGMRGAIVCFLTPAAITFLVIAYQFSTGNTHVTGWEPSRHDPLMSAIPGLIAGSLGTTLVLGLVGFPARAIGLWLRGILHRR